MTKIGDGAFQGCTGLTSIKFLGLGAPTEVGEDWVENTAAGIRGHAFAASNFPVPGIDFHGLVMGAVLPIVPGAPTDLTAVVVDGKVVIEWDIPSFDGGRLITGYILYRSDGTNGSFAAMIAPITGPKYTDGDVTKGQTYWYHVAAVNANGVGAHSEEVSVEIKAADGGDSTVLIPGTVLAIAMLLVVVFFFARWKK